jgi:dihydroorotate dehydrogenase
MREIITYEDMTFKEKLISIFCMMYSYLKPLLFSLGPEAAHHLTLEIARLCPSLGELSGMRANPSLSVKVGSVNWTFPIGLAAGLDKNAEALSFFTAQGFGAIECGTVTVRPQLGNLKPRLFRYPEEESLRNAMGFPNHGLLEILPRLRAHEGSAPIGVNIGKNKESTPEESIEELSVLFETLKDHADYFVVNVSSPNTPGLRALQERSYLKALFGELNQNREGKDLYLKIAPDLNPNQVNELTQIAVEEKLTGIIATNTTMMPERGMGGVSGRLLQDRARSIHEMILNENPPIELICVGGISDPKDLFEIWKLGGKAAQVYTAYVYQGPELLKNFQRKLEDFTQRQEISLQGFFDLPLEERRYRLKNF